MSSRGGRRLLLLGLAAGAGCLSQDLCSLSEQARGFAPPRDADAYTVLDTIGRVVPFQTRTIKLFPTSNALVKQRGGAAAQLCGHNANERWIFFDPDYVEAIKPNGGKSDLPRFFVLAHEAAHHINGDTLIGNDWTKDQELAADYSAAVWLTRLGVTRDQLLQTFNALGFPSESVNGYPKRAERLSKVIQGYEEAHSAFTPPGVAAPSPPSSSTEEPPTKPPQDTRPEPSQAQQDQDYREQLERCYAVAQASCMSDCIDKYHNSDKTCRQKLCSREIGRAHV